MSKKLEMYKAAREHKCTYCGKIIVKNALYYKRRLNNKQEYYHCTCAEKHVSVPV